MHTKLNLYLTKNYTPTIYLESELSAIHFLIFSLMNWTCKYFSIVLSSSIIFQRLIIWNTVMKNWLSQSLNVLEYHEIFSLVPEGNWILILITRVTVYDPILCAIAGLWMYYNIHMKLKILNNLIIVLLLFFMDGFYKNGNTEIQLLICLICFWFYLVNFDWLFSFFIHFALQFHLFYLHNKVKNAKP